MKEFCLGSPIIIRRDRAFVLSYQTAFAPVSTSNPSYALFDLIRIAPNRGRARRFGADRKADAYVVAGKRGRQDLDESYTARYNGHRSKRQHRPRHEG